MPFVFGNLHAPGVELYTGNGTDRKVLSDLVQGAWIAFARSGDPNHPDLPTWPAYRVDDRATLVFDETARVEDDPMAEERALWDDVPFDGLNPAIERCVPSTRDILASFLRTRSTV